MAMSPEHTMECMCMPKRTSSPKTLVLHQYEEHPFNNKDAPPKGTVEGAAASTGGGHFMQSAHPETASIRERNREGGARETLAGRQTAAQGNKRPQSKARSQPQGSVPGAQRARAVSLSGLSMWPIETGTALHNMLTKALPSRSDALPETLQTPAQRLRQRPQRGCAHHTRPQLAAAGSRCDPIQPTACPMETGTGLCVIRRDASRRPSIQPPFLHCCSQVAVDDRSRTCQGLEPKKTLLQGLQGPVHVMCVRAAPCLMAAHPVTQKSCEQGATFPASQPPAPGTASGTNL